MGLLVIATFIAVARIGGQRNPPRGEGSGDGYDTTVRRLRAFVRTPAVWSVTFVVVAVGVGALAVLAVGDFGLPEGTAPLLLNVVYGLVGLLITGFVFLGAYFGARGRGLGNAHGVAAGSFAAGLVFLVVITVQLLT
ncbi:hypothetical protein [Halorubrum vacuolatum]|uniref:Uncharacterized protein n=1 Tax=Halorubrum vacuolatum TaxID=63740 RepID=A0A238WLX6_HALVU|nr:hypothetical protein [Halorubrum vacuolatum]SNR47303.1 hypothetical protein SAMN06264855_108120 [Halorubrum vacuolatum]